MTCYGDPMTRRWIRGLAGLPLVALTVACDDNSRPITTPDPVAVTETFSATLTPNDAESHPFSSSRGTVTATLTAVAPDNTMIVGFSLGTWNGISCAVSIANDKALQGTSIIGTVNGTGNLCVRLYDVGAINEALSYEVRVVHF
jgi:hypothetical protein